MEKYVEATKILSETLGSLDGRTVGMVLGFIEGLASDGRRFEVEVTRTKKVFLRLRLGPEVKEFSGDSLALVLADVAQKAS